MLTRQGSTHEFPKNVSVKFVDYDSKVSLSEALTGQDAVVCAIASAALAKQQLLVEAVVDAGVKRYIPSEFGSNTSNAMVRQLPVFKDKIIIQDLLKEKAAAGQITYTLVNNGAFLDWGIKLGLIADAKNRKLTLFDGGHRRFSTTTLAAIGTAVAGVLKHPAETENRVVYVQSAALTLKDLSSLGQKATGTTWEETTATIDDQLAKAWAELKREKPDPAVFVVPFLLASIFGEGYGNHFVNNDNELLGVKTLGDADIVEIIRNAA